jgi:2-iminoacetate synthase
MIRNYIGIFGRQNVGKSSLTNALTNQEVALVSPVPGTTADPVYKAMELQPLGPVTFIDTAGIDGIGELAEKKKRQTWQVLRKINLALLVIESSRGVGRYEKEIYQKILKYKIPIIIVVNKIDIKRPAKVLFDEFKTPQFAVSCKTLEGIPELRKLISQCFKIQQKTIIGDLIEPNDLVVLVAPISPSSPVGRIKMPIIQTQRDILEHQGCFIVCRETNYLETLKILPKRPKLIITDSQVLKEIAQKTPEDLPLTTFSLLLARAKGNLDLLLDGYRKLGQLKEDDKVLVAEACTHQIQEDDIARTLIPRILGKISKGLKIEYTQGGQYPADLKGYDLVIHCGGCLLGEKELENRLSQAREENVPITNYGIVIAGQLGILERLLKPLKTQLAETKNIYLIPGEEREPENIVNPSKIFEILKKTRNPSKDLVEEVLAKAQEKKGLFLEEVAILVNDQNEETREKLFQTAQKIKYEIYGKRLVLFAPLYVSNYCINDCEYCGFHRRNTQAKRKKLTLEEVKKEVEILENMGHKRLLLEFGEHPQLNPIDYVVDVIKTIYQTKIGRGEIRRVNVNIAATTVESYKKLKAAGIGTYQLFQETYHPPTYKKLHHGPKADYKRQITAMDRAFRAGIDDLGLGVLFGFYDWRFEVLSLVSHAQYLDQKFGVGPHTISVPRFRPAPTVDYQPEYPVSDQDFLRIIAILRVSVPYTGMIISTRERPEIRTRAFEIGISQTSAGSKTSPGGYSQKEEMEEQFSISDHRSLDGVVQSICAQELLPSFCTACYRSGRTGGVFMNLAKPGDIHHFCQPNAILTFQEYLCDYASPETKKLGREIIQRHLELIEGLERKEETLRRIQRIKKGERDLYF